MTCDLCPAPAVAFVPGDAEVRIGPFLLQKGRRLQCYCISCWCQTFRTVEARAREAAE